VSGTAVREPWTIIVGRVAAIIGVLIVVFVIGPALLFGLLLTAGTQRTVFERSLSPDGWTEARVQFDDAGAVSTFSRLVFVKSRWNPSDQPLLSCRAFFAQGEEAVHLRWSNRQTLLIQHGFSPQAVQAVAPNCGKIRIIVEAAGPTAR
jgi:hypothetical protein